MVSGVMVLLMLCFGEYFPHARHDVCHAFKCDALGNGFWLG